MIIVNDICSHIGNKLTHYLESYGIYRHFLEGRGFVAGGCVRSLYAGEKISDIDYYSVGTLPDPKAKAGFSNENTQSYSLNNVPRLDLIKGKYDIDLIEGFDFTVCCAVLYFHDGFLHLNCHPYFFTDVLRKRLRINETPNALATARRLAKYVAKGYKPCAGTMQVLALAIARQTKTIEDKDLAKVFYKYVD